MRTPSSSNQNSFLSSLGMEHTAVALLVGLAVIVFLLLDVLGKEDPTTEPQPTEIQATENPLGEFRDLEL